MDILPPLIEAESSSQALRRYWHWAPIVAFIFLSLHLGLIRTLDDTNLGTTNGLWKAPSVAAWEHGAGNPVDSGGVWYAKGYGFLAWLIPDGLVQFGVQLPMVTFRKIALLNGIFGGLASGLVFLLALRFTGSLGGAGISALAHAFAAFILLNSLNSEDIIPAYTLFLACVVCGFEFLYVGKLWLLALSATLFAAATLLHWTLMTPGLAAYGILFAMLLTRGTSYLAAAGAWFLIFLVAIKVAILLLPGQLTLWAVILPLKAAAGGWSGFRAEKLIYLTAGIGNYFSGAQNVRNYAVEFSNPLSVLSMSVSWCYALLTLSVCFATAFGRRAAFTQKCLAAFAIVLFLTGEAEATYSQPQDPQLQIQPLLAAAVGVILLVRQWHASTRTFARRLLAAGSLAALLLAGLTNIVTMRSEAGSDSRLVNAVRELDRLFPRQSTVVVSQGFEDWNTWRFTLTPRDGSIDYFQRTVGLFSPFTNTHGATGRQAALEVRRQIDGALASGLQVVASALWTESPADFVASMTTIASGTEAYRLDAELRSAYRLGRHWDTSLGRFVELLPLTLNGEARRD